MTITTEDSKEFGSVRRVQFLEQELDNAKKLYTKGYVNDMDVHIFPTLPDLLEYLGYDRSELSFIRTIATRDNWGQLRSLHKETLDQARRVEMLKKKEQASEVFDEECLLLAKAGLRQVKAHFAKSQAEGPMKGIPLATKELVNVSASLQKFQVVGRIALGDTKSSLTEKIDSGMDLESLSKEELKNLNAILANAEKKRLGIENE